MWLLTIIRLPYRLEREVGGMMSSFSVGATLSLSTMLTPIVLETMEMVLLLKRKNRLFYKETV